MRWFINQKNGFTYKVMPFKDIPIGARFGNVSTIYVKKSSRTASIDVPSRFRFKGTWFYMPMSDQYIAELKDD